MKDPDLVSVGMPVRNGGKYLELALDSILAQDYKNLEIIISDNESNDKTADIVKKYQRLDSRIIYHRQNKMVPAFENFMSVLDSARGQYFMWAAHDDIRSTNYISKLMVALEKDEDLILSFGDLYVSDKVGEKGNSQEYTFDNSHSRQIIRMWKTANMQCFHIYGLWRTSLLKRIKIHHCTWLPDMPVMVAAASIGGFKYIPGPWFSYFEVQKNHQERAEYQDSRANFNRASGVMELIASSFFTTSSATNYFSGLLASCFVALKQMRMTFGYLTRRINSYMRISGSN